MAQDQNKKIPGGLKPLVGIYRAPIDDYGSIGRWIRHRLLDAILYTSPFLLVVQKHRRPWLDYLMHFLSFLGTEEFYTPIVILLAWVVNVRLARLFTILMAIGFYFSTSLKNFFRMPRPPCPPISVLEVTYDWALPSLHAIIGLMLPWYIFLYSYRNLQLDASTVVILFCIIFTWSSSVMISRLYLGVHSPADIFLGWCIGASLLTSFLYVDNWIDEQLLNNTTAVPLMFLLYAVVLYVHPGSNPPTQSYAETITCHFVAFGVAIGTKRTLGDMMYYSSLMEQATVPYNVSRLVGLGFVRLIIGFPLIMLVRLICKAIVKNLASVLLKSLGVEIYSLSHYKRTTQQLSKHYNEHFIIPPIHGKAKEEDSPSTENISNGSDKRNHSTANGASDMYSKLTPDNGQCISDIPLDVDIPTKMVTYTMMSWVAVEFIHPLFHYLGLVLK